MLRGFYDFHRDAGSGPMVDPFPLARRGARAHAHHNPMDLYRNERTGLYRPRQIQRVPRSIPDYKFNELFAQLGSHRAPGTGGLLGVLGRAGIGAPRSSVRRRRPRAAADHGSKEVLFRLRLMHPEITIVWADSAYAGKLVTWAKKYLNLTIKAVSRPKDTTGFIVLPRRWVVERTHAWIMHARRHARDYERLVQHSETLITWAAITLMTRRITRTRPAPSPPPARRRPPPPWAAQGRPGRTTRFLMSFVKLSWSLEV